VKRNPDSRFHVDPPCVIAIGPIVAEPSWPENRAPDQEGWKSVRSFAYVKNVSFDSGLRSAGVVIFIRRPGLTRFVRDCANRSTQYHVGARLLWARLSPRPIWLLCSQRHGICAARGSRAGGTRGSRSGGTRGSRSGDTRAGCVPVRVLPWPVWPLLAVLNLTDPQMTIALTRTLSTGFQHRTHGSVDLEPKCRCPRSSVAR